MLAAVIIDNFNLIDIPVILNCNELNQKLDIKIREVIND